MRDHNKKKVTDAAWRARNREKCHAYFNEYYRNNKHKWYGLNQRRREQHGANWPRVSRQYWIKHKYGITVEEFDQLLIAQLGLCAICDQQMICPHVDHDHKTGKVRGLLCTRCNNALERVERFPTWGVRAMEYLAK